MNKILFAMLLGAVSCLAQGDVTVKRISESGDSPRISADGRFVAFVAVEGGVFVSNLETGEIERADTNVLGEPGNFLSGFFGISISADGNLVAFSSSSTNLVPDDRNNQLAVFVKNLETGEVIRVSADPADLEQTFSAINPSISADGRYVAFETNNDIYRSDLETSEIVRVSEDASGVPGNSFSLNAAINSDGRFVSFHSEATNLVPDDTKLDGLGFDVFLKDMVTGEILRVNESAQGVQGNGFTFHSSSISADGRFVAFDSTASNLVPDDTNETTDVFVKNVQTGDIVRASEDAAGNEGSGFDPRLSADGRFVAFESGASNLVSDDTNNFTDVFAKNLVTGEIQRVNTGPTPWGNQANNVSNIANLSISADGRFVAFRTNATNLIAGESVGGVFVADTEGVNAPSIPGNIDYAVYSESAAEVFWDRVSNNGNFLYEIIRNGETLGTFDALSLFDDDLQPGVTYTYSVTPMDSNGFRLATGTVSFTTGNNAATSETDPTEPGNLRSLVYSDTAAEIFWSRSSDDGFVQGYEITRNGKSLRVLDVLSVFEDDLNPDTIYTYTVTAIDNEGNRSAPATISLSTGDRQPPSPITPAAPTGLRAEVYSATAAELFWDRTTVFGLSFEVQRNGEVVSLTDGVSYFDATLSRGQTFQYEIVTVDLAGTRSAAATITVSTD